METPTPIHDLTDAALVVAVLAFLAAAGAWIVADLYGRLCRWKIRRKRGRG